MGDRTGYKPIDYILDMAEKRGLHVEVKESNTAGFVVAHITNRGLAGENGLNDESISLQAYFGRSKRGSFVGGGRYVLLGKPMRFPCRHARSALSSAYFWVSRMYVTEENLTEWDRERRAAEQAEYERTQAWLEARQARVEEVIPR